MAKLEGKTALVTGGASGIGEAVVNLMAKEGAKVVVADFNGEGAQKVANSLLGLGYNAIADQVDISKPEEVEHMVNKAVEKFEAIDILVNVAGVLKLGTVTETSLETWKYVLDINLTGTFLCCKAVLPLMMKQCHGSIVNFSSSTGAQVATNNLAAYVVSKGGVALLTRSIALDYAEYNIRANAVCPGPTKTSMFDSISEEQIKQIAASIPLGRLANRDEIAKIVVFLASNDSSFVTGALISGDGGQTASI